MPTATIAYATTPLLQGMHASPARWRVLDCGRRFGKSFWGLVEGLLMSIDLAKTRPTPLPRGVVVAPTVPMLREDWTMAKTLFHDLLRQAHEADYWLDLGALGVIDFKSSESQHGVGRGAGYDWAFVDEAARVPELTWTEELRPALADRRGKALFASTPFGRNWFHRLFRQGQSGDPETQSWRYTTIEGWRARYATDPARLADAEAEWGRILATTSERTLQQEYLADFLGDEGQLWSLAKCARGTLRGPLPGRHYVGGLDIARVNDWMACAVLEAESKQLVALTRFRQRAWDRQKREALWLFQSYPKCHVLVDSTGVGDPIAFDLRQAGLDLEDMVFTSRNKGEMVENLSVALDHGYLGLPKTDETEWLWDELLAYRETKLASGHVRYSAPEGQHDDGVTALMLAAWGLRFELSLPALDEAPPTEERSLRDWMAYQRKVDEWKRLCPDLSVPAHPGDLRWRFTGRWLRRRPLQPIGG